MKTKNIYLLVFCVLLTYYCYLCKNCQEITDENEYVEFHFDN